MNIINQDSTLAATPAADDVDAGNKLSQAQPLQLTDAVAAKVEPQTPPPETPMQKLGRLKIPDLFKQQDLPKEEYIRRLYNVLFQREPESFGFERYKARENLDTILSELIVSDEFKRISRSPNYPPGLDLAFSKRPRVLLFGAYGNCNLGDAIQAASIQRAINALRPDIDVWACSVLPSPFPFPYDKVLPARSFANPSIVNSFDLLIIGGGGLLSHPHDPLTDDAWQKSINIPIVLLGVGATPNVAEKSLTLIQKAKFVSARDWMSEMTLKRFTSTVKYMPDPVLCDPHFDVGASPGQHLSSKRNLWILKYTGRNSITEAAQLAIPDGDEVCFLEPHLDFPLIQVYPRAIPIYFVQDLIALIDRADNVFSTRFHGCILSMLRRKPAFGFQEQKIKDLLTKYGNAQAFSKTLSRGELSETNYNNPYPSLIQDRGVFVSQLAEMLALVKS